MHRALARVFAARNDLETARAHAASAEQAVPGDPRSAVVAATIALRRLEPAMATRTLDRALQATAGQTPALRPVERAEALRLQARALLMLGALTEADARAKEAGTIVWASSGGRALLAFIRKRSALHLKDPETATTSRHEILTDLGADVAETARRRLAELEAALEPRLPLPDGPLRTWRTRVYLLSRAAYGIVQPQAGARAFYQRDERAVYVYWRTPIEAQRLLAHEAVHAHLHRLIEDPPAWLDEGLADYGAMLRTEGARPAKRPPSPHPIRLRDLQVSLFQGHQSTLAEITHLDRRALYTEENLERHFASCWGYVYGLQHAARGRHRPRFVGYLQAVLAGASGPEAFTASFGAADVPAIEADCRQTWEGLREGP
jgi:hypothetical protein